MKTYAICNTNNRPRKMGCDSQYGNLGLFLPTWYGGRCHDCFRGNHGFHRDRGCCESRFKNVPQQARLRVFWLLMALEEEKSVCACHEKYLLFVTKQSDRIWNKTLHIKYFHGYMALVGVRCLLQRTFWIRVAMK